MMGNTIKVMNSASHKDQEKGLVKPQPPLCLCVDCSVRVGGERQVLAAGGWKSWPRHGQATRRKHHRQMLCNLSLR